jgi:hypothetical protein
MPNDPKDKPSSIVMRGIDASTFSELQAFTEDLESRPVDRLLKDIAELVQPSESKAQIVGYVIATKFRHAPVHERDKILESLDVTIRGLKPGGVRERIVAIVKRIQTRER